MTLANQIPKEDCDTIVSLYASYCRDRDASRVSRFYSPRSRHADPGWCRRTESVKVAHTEGTRTCWFRATLHFKLSRCTTGLLFLDAGHLVVTQSVLPVPPRETTNTMHLTTVEQQDGINILQNKQKSLKVEKKKLRILFLHYRYHSTCVCVCVCACVRAVSYTHLTLPTSSYV